jgi:(p)ppGpp synthase/HD superfamily hydrolase
MPTPERALEIAQAAHIGQRDKAGYPYISHVRRVADAVAKHGTTVQTVALLHDLIEDCPGWSLDRLRGEGFSEEIITAVSALTRGDETYTEFIERLSSNPIARTVKRADLIDNLRLDRLSQISDADLRRAEKYIAALRRLL